MQAISLQPLIEGCAEGRLNSPPHLGLRRPCILDMLSLIGPGRITGDTYETQPGHRMSYPGLGVVKRVASSGKRLTSAK